MFMAFLLTEYSNIAILEIVFVFFLNVSYDHQGWIYEPYKFLNKDMGLGVVSLTF